MTTAIVKPPLKDGAPPDGEHRVGLRADLASTRFLTRIPRDFTRQHLILSQGEDDDTERLVASDATDPAAIFNVGVRLRATVCTSMCNSEAIARAIDEAYARCGAVSHDHDPQEAASSANGESIDALLAQADRDLLSTQGKGPVVRLVDALLFEALGRRATDVHIQPLSDRTLVRYRLDGVLHTVRELTRKTASADQLTNAIISRIKVMGRMDIAEKRVPQDGRASVTIGSPAPGMGDRGRSIDLRISTLPTSYGERAVIRLLDNSHVAAANDLESLGMPPEVSRPFLERAGRSSGIILVTGPTGSGKTTTLYATLRRIGSPGLNITTIEDPIEYELSTAGLAISQSQVNTKKGVTFATGLRHILRQDPDVIMVGEIRDAETARIAIQSSLTGHLVFSTLHTNDAPGAVTRLIDLGVEPYLTAASLSAVLAQRLVRLIHQPCSGEGCDECFGTGYLGRTGVFELFMIDERVRQLIVERAPLAAIRGAARDGGMRTLVEEGTRQIQAGITSRLEVNRVIQGIDE